MLQVTAYCAKWHLEESSAFRALVEEPLCPFMDIGLREWVDDRRCVKEARVFCMIPPPRELLGKRDERLVWVPMWDNVVIKGYTQAWWNQLPKNLRVVAFSRPVADCARRAGLQVLRLQYFCDPRELAPVGADAYDVMFYWDRRGLYSAEFLRCLCGALGIRKLILRERLDPCVPRSRQCRLPAKLDSTEVEVVTGEMSAEDYRAVVRRAGVFLAPRASEGAGLAVIEALAMGAAVFSPDETTMNEYIRSTVDGYLFRRAGVLHQRWTHVRNHLSRYHPFKQRELRYPMTSRQDWEGIATLSLSEMGRAAREAHGEGHRQWREASSDLIRFLTEWDDMGIE